MVRQQSTKELAQRIEPSYVRRHSGRRWLRGFLSLLFIAGAATWWWAGDAKRRNVMLNPGHVSAAHAMWENDCAKCHETDGKDGFRAAVSDNACLQCHGATAHHPLQLLRTGPDAHNALALAVRDEKGAMRSADCVACHVEHRGRPALMAENDATCTRCHQNLANAVNHGVGLTVSASVTAFDDKGGHPFFGRALLAAGKEFQERPAVPLAPPDPAMLLDPAHLHFNHSNPEHLKLFKDATGAENCALCHVNQVRGGGDIWAANNPSTRPAVSGINSNSGNADAPAPGERALVRQGRYMQPVYRYAENCASTCHTHELKIEGGPLLPHVKLERVLAQVGNINDFYRRWLLALPKEEQAKKLDGKAVDEWVTASAEALRNNMSTWVSGVKKGSLPGAEPLEAELIALPDEVKLDTDAVGKNVRIMAAYFAFGMNSHAQSCSICHDMKQLGDPATSPAPPATAPGPDSEHAVRDRAQLRFLATVPTGIPDAPRQWFVHSTFDHQAHGNMTCNSCHVRPQSTEHAIDIPPPNLVWTSSTGQVVSCAKCHLPANSPERGARASCITCHSFHEHSELAAPASVKEWPGRP